MHLVIDDQESLTKARNFEVRFALSLKVKSLNRTYLLLSISFLLTAKYLFFLFFFACSRLPSFFIMFPFFLSLVVISSSCLSLSLLFSFSFLLTLSFSCIFHLFRFMFGYDNVIWYVICMEMYRVSIPILFDFLSFSQNLIGSLSKWIFNRSLVY